jgi:hypothetical protein
VVPPGHGYANDLGLLAEEADEATGELLGNMPQAFSHIGLINAAWRLAHPSAPAPCGFPRPTRRTTTWRSGMTTRRLDGKIALITGSDSGIGQATAIAFADEGADVVVHYLHDADGAERTRAGVEAAGRRCVVTQADVQEETRSSACSTQPWPSRAPSTSS